jgi:hypothetical protein
MIKIEIPWTSLFPTCTKPVVVRISGVVVNLAPSSHTTVDPEKQKEKDDKQKQERLAQYEKSLVEQKSATDPSFTERLVASIINNVQVPSR